MNLRPCSCLSLVLLTLVFGCSAVGESPDGGDGDGDSDGPSVDGTGSTVGTGGGTPGGGSGGTGSDTGAGAASGTGGGGNDTGGTGSGGGTPGGCAAAEFCDDFEDGIDAAWEIQKDSTPAPVVDTTKAKSGASSLKVTGTTQQAFVAYPVPAQKFYAKANVNFSMGTAEMGGHGWFIVAADNVTQGEESQIRWGSSGNHGHNELDMNVYAGTCGGEKTQFSDGASDGLAGWNGATTDPVLLSADTWYCVEIMFDGPSHEARVWIDGDELTGLHVTSDTMCADWSPTYTHIKFGGGANGNIGDIWYDDVAVSTTPIGCD